MSFWFLPRRLLSRTRWLLASAILVLAACADNTEILLHQEPGNVSPNELRAIYVTSNGWHSGIVLEVDDMLTESIPETADFSQARFLEFGWGDAEYYPAEKPSIGMGLRAVFVPTETVLHIAAMRVTPDLRYPESEVIPLSISPSGRERLIGFISRTFRRNGDIRTHPVSPGLHSNSHFYPAKGEFHMFNTCNTWTARALRHAGIDIHTEKAHSAEELMGQLRTIGNQ